MQLADAQMERHPEGAKLIRINGDVGAGRKSRTSRFLTGLPGKMSGSPIERVLLGLRG